MAKTLAIVLAAGKGTRMRSSLPKVMHPVAGLPLVAHVLKAVTGAGVCDAALVVAPEATWASAYSALASAHVQAEAKGTAHAVLAAREAVRPDHEAVVVLFADNPLITAATIDGLLSALEAGADVAVLAFETDAPHGYGRIVEDGAGGVAAIVEERDASEAERAITLCNSGVLAVRCGAPFETIAEIGSDNAKGEFYLTDLVALARAKGLTVALSRAPFDEVMGVNTRAQLVEAEAAFQRRARAAAVEVAHVVAPETVYFSHDTVIGADAVIEPYVVFAPGVSVGPGASVRAFSHLEGARVGPGAVVGPYARLRPGADVGDGARVGNFVEVKAATLGPGAKVNHLSYVGDASVGAGANLGAGTITCNYDGAQKHRTVIGEGAFIGSNSALVAPVEVGARGYVASGSVVTDDVPDEALAIARGRQVNKDGRSPAARKKS